MVKSVNASWPREKTARQIRRDYSRVKTFEKEGRARFRMSCCRKQPSSSKITSEVTTPNVASAEPAIPATRKPKAKAVLRATDRRHFGDGENIQELGGGHSRSG